MRFLKRTRDRIEKAQRDLAEAEKARKEAEAKWPEVRQIEVAAHARYRPPPDELTKLFLKTLGGHP